MPHEDSQPIHRRDPFFRYSVLNGADDHEVLLDRRELVDLVVVGERLVIGGDEAEQALEIQTLCDIETHMTVEHHVGALAAFLGEHDGRLDDADFPHGCLDP